MLLIAAGSSPPVSFGTPRPARREA